METSGQPSPDPILARATDGSICVFEDFEEGEGHLDVVGVLEGAWTVFYSLDGEVLVPQLDKHNWVEQLIRTKTHDLPGLTEMLIAYAGEHDFDTDGTDARAFANEMRRRAFEARSPKRPRWLDRRLHGGAPKEI